MVAVQTILRVFPEVSVPNVHEAETLSLVVHDKGKHGRILFQCYIYAGHHTHQPKCILHNNTVLVLIAMIAICEF